MSSMDQVKTAQDALNAAIDTAVNDFLTNNPDMDIVRLNVGLRNDADNNVAVVVNSEIASTDSDGSRIVRRVPS